MLDSARSRVDDSLGRIHALRVQTGDGRHVAVCQVIDRPRVPACCVCRFNSSVSLSLSPTPPNHGRPKGFIVCLVLTVTLLANKERYFQTRLGRYLPYLGTYLLITISNKYYIPSYLPQRKCPNNNPSKVQCMPPYNTYWAPNAQRM